MIYTEDFQNAVAKGLRSDLQDAFRALINYPGEDEIEARAPVDLAAMLKQCCELLGADEAVMPSDSCAALDLPAGSTYAEATRAAQVQAPRLRRRFADALDRLAGRRSIASGRAA